MCILPGEKSQRCPPGQLQGDWAAGEAGWVWEGDSLPGSQLGGVQDTVFALPLNEWLGVPLGLAPQQGRVALVHGRALRLHLEGDEHWMGRAR